MNTAEWADAIKSSISTVIYGKEDVIEKLLVALLCRGHVLLEDVPGVGKTILARAFSTSLGGQMQRIQCTPDLLPADVLGVSIYNQKSGEFDFREGPIITNVLLVDEINRATPRTQSALLEAMEEGRITVEGRTIELPKPFFMIATENPVEFEGTFPLPEAQKDRFFLSTRMGYPPEISEKDIMESQRRITHPVTDLKPVTDVNQVLELQKEILSINVDESLVEYIMDIVESTRNDTRLKLGASPRASMALYKGAQALAAIRGRDEAIPDDIKELVSPVLWKRISVKSENLLKGLTEETAVDDLVERIEVPPPKGAA
jgi:MoxR-like ATPase